MSDLLARAERWLADDPDPSTQGELRSLLDQARAGGLGGLPPIAAVIADLEERFAGPLEFGTAGLRGLLGAGESRMNRAVVLRTCAGLAAYLLRVEPSVKERGVVIGYDGRHRSRDFAEDTACALAAVSIPSFLSPRPCPTPLTAFAVTELGAAAGVMVTASHNPPAYNGYKVYWGNGAQIIPPHDKGIAAAIAEIGAARAVPRLALAEARAKHLARDLDDTIERSYLDAIRALSLGSGGDRSMRIAYTPLHGVGDRLARRAFAEAGFTHVSTVAEQAEPDGDFPTVAFPNPEEKGALDLAHALARSEDAAVVIANDPDVDRLAVSVKGPNGYVQLTGNQVGVLLGHHLLSGETSPDRLVITTIVSSPMLGAIARKLGVRYEETLTGFKWIANRAMEIEAEGPARFVFGYEEALGYTIGRVVRDKDGISAAVVMAELAATLHAKGQTLLDELEALYRKYGLFVSGQRSVTMPGSDGLARIVGIMKQLRAASATKIGALAVVAVSDYQSKTRTEASGSTQSIALPPSNVLAYELEGGSRLIVRPSGTEPKIKLYVDIREEVVAGEAMTVADARAQGKMSALFDAASALAGLTSAA